MIKSPDNVAKHTSQVNRSLPSFVIENHPKFVEFLKAYYKWNSSVGSAAALNYMKVNNDIDFVMDSMLDGYTNLVAYNIPREMKTEYRFFLRFLKEFYELKGSEESYKILYRALFNEDVSVFYPITATFQLSAAKWNIQKRFNISFSGDGYSLRGMKATGLTSGATCTITDVVKVRDFWTVNFNKQLGDLIPDETISFSDTEETATVLSSYKIKNVVSNGIWSKGDVLSIDDDLSVYVDLIHTGKIIGVTIVDGGSGYKKGDAIRAVSEFTGTGFYATVSTVDETGAVTALSINRSGFGYESNQIQFVGGSGTGLQLTATWNDDFMKIRKASIVSNTVKTSIGEETFNLGNGQSITFEDGVYTEFGIWETMIGTPSTEVSYLHDSNYYQEHSYSLVSNADTEEKEDAMRKALQIAGLKMFFDRTVSKVVTYQLH